MDHKKTAKQLTGLNKSVLDNTFNTIEIPPDHSEQIFFRFVDKNPLFPDNSKDAIQEYILDSRKRRSDFKSHFDKGHENVVDSLVSNNFHHRNK